MIVALISILSNNKVTQKGYFRICTHGVYIFMKVELQSSTIKAQTLEAGQFVESMLTSERNGKWNEKDVTKEIYNILNEDMIVAVDLAILASGHQRTHQTSED